MIMRQSEMLAKQYEAQGLKALDMAKKELVKEGFKPEQIDIKLQVCRNSRVMDIIQESEKGLYDALVLGRRGQSWLMEALDESVSEGLLEKKINIPIWMCHRPDPERKDILVCVDGSDASYRMADHVGFILGQEKDQRVTFLMVSKKGATMTESSESVLSKSMEHLLNNGFPPEMTKTRVVEAENAAKAIIREADQGRFAAVAAGRTGAGQGLLERIFMGSVSTTLLRELERTALWICH